MQVGFGSDSRWRSPTKVGLESDGLSRDLHRCIWGVTANADHLHRWVWGVTASADSLHRCIWGATASAVNLCRWVLGVTAGAGHLYRWVGLGSNGQCR